MKIAIQGCSHGQLDDIYNTIEYIEKHKNIHIDLLLCCGDFEAIRNLEDVKCMAAPSKYARLQTFHKYYSGEKVAPKLTIFIGGNHEASNYLQELPYGGWVAPNIYYLGYAGVVNCAGVRIAGLSGIYKDWDYSRGRFEKPPYNEETKRSCYHFRNIDVFRLKQLSSAVQIMMSHEWPNGIVSYGNVERLLKMKPFFREDIANNSLGNKPSTELLECLKPDYWFAAHLHVKFAAVVNHDKDSENKLTKFLALDKCLPGRKFLQILDIPHDETCEIELKYDLEWLTILHLTNHLLGIRSGSTYMPQPGSDERWIFTPTKDEMNSVLNKLENNLVIPKNFVQTAAPHGSNLSMDQFSGVNLNPQTVELCNKISVDDPIALLLKEDGANTSYSRMNSSNFESNSFMGLTDSELDASSQSNTSEISVQKIARTPLKLPTPILHIAEKSEDDFLTSTPLNRNKKKASDAVKDSDCSNMGSTVSEKSDMDNLDSVVPKKFGRRNIAFYGNVDEE